MARRLRSPLETLKLGAQPPGRGGSAAPEVTMELDIVDQLISYLAADPKSASHKMRAIITEEQVLQAWVDARLARFTESTGLGMDRLTPRRPGTAETVSKVITSKDSPRPMVYVGSCDDDAAPLRSFADATIREASRTGRSAPGGV